VEDGRTKKIFMMVLQKGNGVCLKNISRISEREEFLMAKLIVMYQEPKDKAGFENHYFHVHIPLAQKLPNLRGASVHRVLQSQNSDRNEYLIAELEFDSVELLTQSLGSPVGAEVSGDVAHLMRFLHQPPVILIAE
jgi:uncharacterized protein (TIGR02118 family)